MRFSSFLQQPAGLLMCLLTSVVVIGGCHPSPSGISAISLPVEIQPKTTHQVQVKATEPITTTVRDDLFVLIQAGLDLPQYDSLAIDQQIRWHQDHPDYLQRVWQRSRPFLGYVVNEVQRRGLPMELALLPVVESGYQPYGYSHARAAGLWQFIPSTGRMFGLRQDWWSDQRRDPVAATQAALDYLEQLNKRFDGDWLLALAAYNAGAGRVARAIRHNGGSQVHFSDLQLSRETASYVPKLLALARMVKQPEKYGLELPVIANQPYFAMVDIHQQTDLEQLSRLAELTPEQLRTLNPALNRWATDPAGPHRILVPVANAKQLQLGLAGLADSERLRWLRHKVATGENLGGIAKQYGVTIGVLKQANQLNGNLIRAGKHLLIPRVEALPERLAASCRGARLSHQVSRGDSLWEIGRRYEVTINHLKRCNPGLRANNLTLGSRITIRDPLALAKALVAPSKRRVDQVVNYRVRRGDSLAAISSRFGVSVKQLIAWNQINPNNYLQPGDKLIVRLNLLDQG